MYIIDSVPTGTESMYVQLFLSFNDPSEKM